MSDTRTINGRTLTTGACVCCGIRRRSFEMILHYLGRAKSTAAWWRSGWTYLFPVAFSTGDWDQIPHFDEVADAIAACYPQVNWGEDACETLYEMLKKERVKKLPALEMYRRAFDLCLSMRGSVLNGTYIPEENGSDEVPF